MERCCRRLRAPTPIHFTFVGGAVCGRSMCGLALVRFPLLLRRVQLTALQRCCRVWACVCMTFLSIVYGLRRKERARGGREERRREGGRAKASSLKGTPATIIIINVVGAVLVQMCTHVGVGLRWECSGVLVVVCGGGNGLVKHAQAWPANEGCMATCISCQYAYRRRAAS